MKLNEAITILKQHNEWRRGSDELPMSDVKELGKAIDLIVSFAEKVSCEPSEGMIIDGIEDSLLSKISTDDPTHVNDIFKAMINQAIKEVEQC